MNTPAPEISQTSDVATLAADTRKLRDYLESVVRPWRDVLGVNGIKVTISATNVLFDGEELYAGDGFGGNAIDSKPPGPTAEAVINPTTPGGALTGEPFTPGDSNTPGASVSYEERTKGGTATLIGLDEYTDTSTPPRKYRKRTLSGRLMAKGWSSGGCGGTLAAHGQDEWAGTVSYDAVTGTMTDTTTRTRTVFLGTGSSGTLAAGGSIDAAFAPYEDTMVTTRLSRYITNPQNCLINPLGLGGETSFVRREETPTNREDLSEEDTEADARSRLLAGASWSSWSSATLPAAAADYTARTSGFTFTYETTELRANYTGLPADWTFAVRVRVAAVNLATGAVNTAFLADFPCTSNGSGDATWTYPITPALRGFTYRVQSVTTTF